MDQRSTSEPLGHDLTLAQRMADRVGAWARLVAATPAPAGQVPAQHGMTSGS